MFVTFALEIVSNRVGSFRVPREFYVPLLPGHDRPHGSLVVAMPLGLPGFVVIEAALRAPFNGV